MNKEEKQLLLKDLCSRLPYGVIVSIKEVDSDKEPWFGELSCKDLDCFIHDVVYESIKPYLRPMSSMTEEEITEYLSMCDKEDKDVLTTPRYSGVDWLLSHHFDFRGLIKKGLALEAPDDMYESKDN